jgi:hypothetical protein
MMLIGLTCLRLSRTQPTICFASTGVEQLDAYNFCTDDDRSNRTTLSVE